LIFSTWAQPLSEMPRAKKAQTNDLVVEVAAIGEYPEAARGIARVNRPILEIAAGAAGGE
jgi:hypothetical protein